MLVAKHTVVTLEYTLTSDNAEGETIEKVDPKNPAVFLIGTGGLIEGFETNLTGKGPGDDFGFLVSSEKGYGARNPELTLDISKNQFVIDGKPADDLMEIGKLITLRDQQGNPVRAKVIGVDDENVTVDYNHPLAGRDLFFKGKIIDVRAASEDEVSHGHVHGPGGVHH